MAGVGDAHIDSSGYASAMAQRQQHAWPEGTLPAILEPWMWVEIIDPMRITGPQGQALDVMRIVGIVKPDKTETVGDLAANLVGLERQRVIDKLARSVRESLHKRAEDAIAAVLEAGFSLNEYPEIDIGGTLRYDRAAGVDVPVAEVRVTLWFRVLENGRP